MTTDLNPNPTSGLYNETVLIAAFQLTNTFHLPQWFLDRTLWSFDLRTKYGMEIRTPNRFFTVRAGDWVVRSPNAAIIVFDNDEFVKFVNPVVACDATSGVYSMVRLVRTFQFTGKDSVPVTFSSTIVWNYESEECAAINIYYTTRGILTAKLGDWLARDDYNGLRIIEHKDFIKRFDVVKLDSEIGKEKNNTQ